MLQERQRAKKKSRTEARNDLPDEVQLLAPEEYDVLDSSLGTFGHTSAQVEVYHTLIMRHSECDETQRIRSYSFRSKTFYCRQIKNAVFMIPLSISHDDFNLANPDHHELVEHAEVRICFWLVSIACLDHCFFVFVCACFAEYTNVILQVLLFFKIRIKDSDECEDLAFVKYFDRYTVQGTLTWCQE